MPDARLRHEPAGYAARAQRIRIPHLVAAAKRVFRAEALSIVAVGPLGAKTKKKLDEIARTA